MTTELTIIKQGDGVYIDSREVAEIIDKAHRHLLRDIRSYCEIIEKFTAPNFGLSDFFVESTYLDSTGRTLPCYLLSKMGCEMVANKLTGEKGVLFTAAYVTTFNAMQTLIRTELESRLEKAEQAAEQALLSAAMPAPRLGEYNACARIIIRALRELGTMPEDIILFLRDLYKPLGIAIAADSVFDLDNEDGSGSELPRMAVTHTAKKIAEMLGIYSTNGTPHAWAVSCILNENLFISNKHKTIVTTGCGNHIGVSVRYDNYAVSAVREWLLEYGYPNEVYGFDRTYNVRYFK